MSVMPVGSLYAVVSRNSAISLLRQLYMRCLFDPNINETHIELNTNKIFSTNVDTLFRAHPAFCSFGTGSSFLEAKRPGREAGHSLPFSSDVKTGWSYTSTHLYVSMASSVIIFLYFFSNNNC